MAQFSNAHHLIIQGGTFTSSIVHRNNKDSECGLHALSLAVSHGAIHDSAERYPPPNCHPDTRKAVRKIILDWIDSESSALPFFWLYGPAGAGKTAILQAIAEFLCERDGNLGASFFFTRGKHGRDQGHFLFSTIAYQLAMNVPGLRQHINHIMEAKPTLYTKSIAVQLKALIVDAFQSLSPPPQRPFLVIIDGLDECQDKATQQPILRLLCDTITVHKLPLRFLIGSRPESHIRVSFDHPSLYTITQRVVLDETFHPRRDIQVFLQDGFADICNKHADIMSHVQQPWPAKGIIDLLVQRSSGQFIYAATVLKFVGADFCNPMKQLALVLKPGSTAFSDLDQLYTQILSVYPSPANIVQVLGIIVAFDGMNLTPEVIEDILEMQEGEVRLLLRGLSSLVAFVADGIREDLSEEGPSEEVYVSYVGAVYFLHASFRDFLVDSSRSGPFHVNEEEYNAWATTKSFALITKWIGRSWRTSPVTRVPRDETWDHFGLYLPFHFYNSPELVKDAIMADIENLVQEFQKISSGGTVDIPFAPTRSLMRILETRLDILRPPPDSPIATRRELDRPGDDLLAIIHEFQKILDQSFISVFSKPGRVWDLFSSLPGIVVQKSLTMRGMAELYGVKMDLLEHLLEWTLEPSSLSGKKRSNVSTCPSYMLERRLSEFLQDRDRAHIYYCDPTLHHALICRQSLSLLDGSNAADLQSDDLPQYFRLNLYDHLCAATEIFLSEQSIPGDHSAVEILNDLDRITYLDANQSNFKSYLAPYVISPILKWVDMLTKRLKAATVFVSGVDLIERLSRLTDRIYRAILFIEAHGSMTTVTIRAPFRRPYTDPPWLKTVKAGVVHLSLELLALELDDRNYSSFADFITNPERSGPMYITQDVYHTQIVEYSLESTLSYQKSDMAGIDQHSMGSVRKCISHALPTERIFYLLRSIDFMMCSSFDTKSVIELLEIIMGWLKQHGSERSSDLCDRLQAAKLTLEDGENGNWSE